MRIARFSRWSSLASILLLALFVTSGCYVKDADVAGGDNATGDDATSDDGNADDDNADEGDAQGSDDDNAKDDDGGNGTATAQGSGTPAKVKADPDPAEAFATLKTLGAETQQDELGRATVVNFVNPISNGDLEVLTRLQALKTLSLRGQTQIDDAAMETIAKLQTVQVIDLGGCVQVTSAGVATIKDLPQLVDINLERNGDRRLGDGILGHHSQAKENSIGAYELGRRIHGVS